jgi:hypothetical protein
MQKKTFGKLQLSMETVRNLGATEFGPLASGTWTCATLFSCLSDCPGTCDVHCGPTNTDPSVVNC